MQAVGYARISIHDQSQNSLPGQVDRITQYCQRNGLTLHKVFIENGQSAFNFARKEWKDLEKYLKEHKEVNHLVIDTMDRFSRANLADALQNNGINV
jgi:site-specific DNA recombinase